MLPRKCHLAMSSVVSKMVVQKVFHWAGIGLLESGMGLFPPPCLQKVKKFVSRLWSAAGVQETVTVAGMTLYHFAPYSLTRFWLLLDMTCVILAALSRHAHPQALHRGPSLLPCHLRAWKHFQISFEVTSTGKVNPVPTNEVSCSNLMW